MKIKKIYILNSIDKNVLECALDILETLAYENNVQLEDFTQDEMHDYINRLSNVVSDITSTDEWANKEDVAKIKEEQEEGIVSYCANCGDLLNDDPEDNWLASDGTLHCCEECALNWDNYEDEDYEE